MVFVGPRGGYRGLEHTLSVSLLKRGREFHEVDVVPDDAQETEALSAIVQRVEDSVRRAKPGSAPHCGEVSPLPALVGYSIGAQAAAMFAACHPGSISSLTLLAGWMEPEEKMRETARVWNAIMEIQNIGESSRSLLALRAAHLALMSAIGWSDDLDAPGLMHAISETRVLMNLCGDASLVSFAERIVDPTLVIGCGADEFATVHQSRRLFGAIVNSRYVEVSSGHLACIERPAQIASLVESFVVDPLRHLAGSRLNEHRP